MAKKKNKTTPLTNQNSCCTERGCRHKGILAILILILIWVNPSAMWSKIAITIAALIILISESPLAPKH